MLDYNSLDEATKNDFNKQLSDCAQAIGGKNYFLQLVESIRNTRPHPLMAKKAKFHFSQGTVTVFFTPFRSHEIVLEFVCRLLLGIKNYVK